MKNKQKTGVWLFLLVVVVFGGGVLKGWVVGWIWGCVWGGRETVDESAHHHAAAWQNWAHC